ncbi:MAG: RidA family protein [Pseudobacteriovorax sp.]|nr:RidA family protein [Pseudobacteriovorax sp.]
MKKDVVSTVKAPAAVGPYSQAVKLGELLFCSGQVPLDPESGQLVVGGIEHQTHQVMKNISEVLKAADLSLSNIVKTTIFLKDMGNFTAVNEVYASYLEKPYPARSTVEVARLPLDVDVEIEVIASF